MQIIIKPKTTKIETQPNIDSSNSFICQPTIEQEKTDGSVSFLKLFRFASITDCILITVGVLGSIVMGAAMPTFAFVTGNMIDSFKNNNVLQEARKNMYYYMVLGVIVLITGGVSYASWMISGENQAVRCRKQYYKSLLKQEVGWFDLEQQSKIVRNFSIDSFSFQLAVGEKISNLIVIIFMLLTGLGIALYMGWILSLVILGSLPIIALGWSAGISRRHAAYKIHQKIYEESDSKAQEVLTSIKLVKQMNAEEFQLQKNQNILQRITDTYRSLGFSYACGSFVGVFTLYAGFTLGFWYGGQCVFGSSACPQSISPRPYSAGLIINILYALFLPAISLNQLTPCLQKISEGRSAASRIFAIIDRVPKIRSSPNSIIPNSIQGIIEFVNVSFAYPTNKSQNILEKFNLKINSGYSGIIGESGCGKSTVFQLLMRFYDPDEGAIFLDGNNLKDLDLQWLRSQIGCVMQEPVLFATSIKENLLLGNNDASEEEIERALKQAEAFDFVYELKDRLDTFVGSGGGQLSGGQKQRIAIARSLLKKPRILLLDEATSALDRVNQKSIMNTLNNVSKDYIIINITHRKKTLKDCSKIYVFQQKKITKTIINANQQKRQTSLLTVPSHNININSSWFSSRDGEKTKQESRSLFVNEKSEANQNVNGCKLENLQNNNSIAKMIDYLSDKKLLLFFGFVAATVDGVAFPTVGLILSKIIIAELKYQSDHQQYSDQIYRLVVYMACLAFAAGLSCGLRQMIFVLLAESSVRKIKSKAYEKVINMPISWFQKEQNQPETVTQKITTSCKILYKFSQSYVSHIFLIGINIIFSIILALFFQWRTGLTALGLIPLMLLAQVIQMKFIQGFSQSKDKIYSQSSQLVSESIMNIRTTYSLGTPDGFTKEYQESLNAVYEVFFKNNIFSGFMFGLSYLLQFLSFGLMFFLAAVYITNSNLEIDGCLTSIFLILFASISAGNHSNYLQDISSAKSSASTIFSIIQMEDEHQRQVQEGSKMLTTSIKGNIQFSDVSFKYMNRDNYALESVSFKIKEGDKVAFVGSSGSGKSTIFNLLLGFYLPLKGKIYIQGIDIKDYDLHHLRRSFGVVSQQPVLFNESIEDNIRYNLTEKSDEEVKQVAKEANFDPDKENIENGQDRHISGFKKNVGPKGSHVSGGQKQRIAIARALLRRPSILLLDEATSALDAQNEEKVQNALDRIMRDKTTISITHRLESTSKMDNIMVIKQGMIAESGNYSKLSQEKTLFSTMHQVYRQSL